MSTFVEVDITVSAREGSRQGRTVKQNDVLATVKESVGASSAGNAGICSKPAGRVEPESGGHCCVFASLVDFVASTATPCARGATGISPKVRGHICRQARVGAAITTVPVAIVQVVVGGLKLAIAEHACIVCLGGPVTVSVANEMVAANRTFNGARIRIACTDVEGANGCNRPRGGFTVEGFSRVKTTVHQNPVNFLRGQAVVLQETLTSAARFAALTLRKPLRRAHSVTGRRGVGAVHVLQLDLAETVDPLVVRGVKVNASLAGLVVSNAVIRRVERVGNARDRIFMVGIVARSLSWAFGLTWDTVRWAELALGIAVAVQAAGCRSVCNGCALVIGDVAVDRVRRLEANSIEEVLDPEAIVRALVKVGPHDLAVAARGAVRASVVEVVVFRAGPSGGSGGRGGGRRSRRGCCGRVLQAGLTSRSIAAATGAIHLQSVLHDATAQAIWLNKG